MYGKGWITEDEYRQVYGEELHFTSSVKYVDVEDYYTDLVIEDVIEDLMETYGYTRTYATNMCISAGLKIYSAEIPPASSRRWEAIYANDANFPAKLKNDKEDPRAPSSSWTMTDGWWPQWGGRGEKTANRVANRATQSVRQPGSSMKPLGVYAPAIELNLITYSSIYNDRPLPTTAFNGRPTTATSKNVNAWTYRDYTVAEALYRSLNTVPVQILNRSAHPANQLRLCHQQIPSVQRWSKSKQISTGKRHCHCNRT